MRESRVFFLLTGCAFSFPILFILVYNYSRLAFSVAAPILETLYPKQAGDLSYLTESPPSVVFPNFIEAGINQGLDNYELGSLMRNLIVGSHHMCGTARFGDVLHTDFRVKGVEGLYVADGAAIPMTTRVNPMATIMMAGRLAGLKALDEGF